MLPSRLNHCGSIRARLLRALSLSWTSILRNFILKRRHRLNGRLKCKLPHFNSQITKLSKIPRRSGQCNGVAVWTDWLLGADATAASTVTSGPITSIEVGKFIQWDMHSRQGVHLLPRVVDVSPNQHMRCQVSFVPADGDITFQFDFK